MTTGHMHDIELDDMADGDGGSGRHRRDDDDVSIDGHGYDDDMTVVEDDDTSSETEAEARHNDQDTTSLVSGSRSFSTWDRRTKIKYMAICTVVVLLFLLTNTGLNVGNKKIFAETGFKFPILMTACHAPIGAVLGLMTLKLGERARFAMPRFKMIDFRTDGLQIFLTGMFFALNVGFNNASYMYISITMNQIVRALNPVFTALTAIVILGERYSLAYWLGIVAVSSGVIMSVYGNPQFHPLGFAFVMISSASAGLSVNLAGYVMKGAQGTTKLDPVNTVIWTALPIFGWCMPLFCWTELMPLISYSSIGVTDIVAIVLLTGLLAYFYNVVHYELISLTSSVYSTIIGNFKVVLLIIVAELFFSSADSGFTALNLAGVIFTLVAFAYVNMVAYMEKNGHDPLAWCRCGGGCGLVVMCRRMLAADGNGPPVGRCDERAA